MVRRKIHFWGKSSWDDWQKEFMWTVQRMTENALPSPNCFSLPHPPSRLKNQIPPSLFPLLTHPLSQTWIANAPALRCFDSPIFKAGSPHVHLFLPPQLHATSLSHSESPGPSCGRVTAHPKRQCGLSDETQVAIISSLMFSWEAGKKISCTMHLTSAQHSNAHPCLSFAYCLYHTFIAKD